MRKFNAEILCVLAVVLFAIAAHCDAKVAKREIEKFIGEMQSKKAEV